MADDKTDTPRMKSLFGGLPKGGFFDLPLASPEDTGPLDLAVIGAPAATPYASVGNYCAAAPDAIRAAFGWPGVSAHHDFDLGGPLLPEGVAAVDWGNLDYSDSDFAFNRRTIAGAVGRALARGAVPLVLGGDDSVPIPVLRAYEGHGPLTILQFDAHIDWRDAVDGETEGLSSNMRRASEMEWVENIVQVGARGIGSARPEDRQDALEWGAQLIPMRDLIYHGVETVIDAIPQGANLYIALDIDALDPAVVPAVIGPAPGGFDYWSLLTIIERAAAKATLVGFNLTELMPAADVGGRGALVAARLTASVLGIAARQRPPR